MPTPFTMTLSAGDLYDLYADMKGLTTALQPCLPRSVRFAARETMLLVKNAMPIWSGRARAGWGIWRKGDLLIGMQIRQSISPQIGGRGLTRFEAGFKGKKG